jgi:hypothetical protein
MDDSRSFHIDIGKYVIEDNYMYNGGGSKTELEDNSSHSSSMNKDRRQVSGSVQFQERLLSDHMIG